MKKLRLKFVALSMGLLLGLLVILLTSINLLNYHSVVDYSDTVMDVLSDNHGKFPEKMQFDKQKQPFSRELPFETRFFSVCLGEDGQVRYADTGKIVTVDTETAIAYAKKVVGGKTSGFLDDYRYRVRTLDSGEFLVVFLDCERRLSDFRYFMGTSIAITLVGYAAVFLLTLFFSKRIMKPFSDNYEKQKRFITDAGHELKTPLAILLADAQVLEEDVGEDNEWIQDIQSQVHRMTDMTNALVSLSRMEEAGNTLQCIALPLSDLVSETGQSFAALAQSQGKTFTMDIAPMLSCCADDKALRQLLSILLENAVKYAGEAGEISLTLRKAGTALRLTVENTSQPIAQEELPHLFDRFYRTDTSRNSEAGGFGIGLSIAKAIVDAHKGTITASVPIENHLRMTVTLPAATAKLP